MSAEMNPLIFRVNPVALQEIAVVKVVVALWQREIAKFPDNVDASSTLLEDALPRAKDFAKVPVTMENLIDKYIARMKISLNDWVRYHYRKIFSPYETKYVLLKYFDELVWRSYAGTIDYRKTALNLVARRDLSIRFRYRFACMYCLEEYVRELWPEVQINGSTRWKENEMYAVSYWDKFMRKKGFDPASFEWLHPSVDNWPQIFYFWSLLKPEDKVEGTIKVITSYFSSSYAKRLLPLLTKTQLETVVRDCPLAVMGSLAYAPEDLEYTVQTWRYMKNKVSVDDFVDLFRMMLNPPLKDVPLISSVLYEIWRDTSEEFKNLVMQKYSSFASEILRMLLNVRIVMENLSGDVRLVIELLRLKNSSYRRAFWLKHWLHLIPGLGSIQLNELMTVCLETDEEVADFKKTHLVSYEHIAQYCYFLIREGFFKELDEFLNFSSTDHTVVTDLKRKLIWTKEILVYCVRYCDNTMEMNKFEEFLAGIFADPDCRRNVKRHMVISPVMLPHLRDALYSGIMGPVKNFVQLFLPRKDDLEIVKNCLVQHCRFILSTAEFLKFVAVEWNEFLLWCVNYDEDKLKEFKKSLPFENIYRSTFQKCVDQVREKLARGVRQPFSLQRNDPVQEDGATGNKQGSDFSSQSATTGDPITIDTINIFDLLDHFLLWYFDSKEKVDEFKLEKAIATQPDHPCGGLITSSNERLAEAVLEWFFNRDKQQIEKYRLKLL